MKSPITRTWLVWSAAIVALVLAVVGIKSCNEYVRTAPDRHAKEYMRTQIADVQAGKHDIICVTNGHRMDAFVKAASGLEEADRFRLIVEYTRETDDFLKQIAALRGVRTLNLGKNDVTSAGMEWVAKLPDLEELSLYEVRVSDAGLKDLAAAPKLRRLEIAPRGDPVEVTIPTILALPHLRELKLCETYPNRWLDDCAKPLEAAHALTKLTLIGTHLSPEAIQSLRDKLPGCTIEVKSVDK